MDTVKDRLCLTENLEDTEVVSKSIEQEFLTTEDASIKILICYHKPSYLLKDDILTPIHVGRAIAKQFMNHEDEKYQWLMSNLIGDDTGENISEKNSSYNEMTSLYWAWKNYEELGNPAYIGMMHYRRHFILQEGEIDVIQFDELDEEHYLEEINYSQDKLHEIVNGCDFVAHIGKVKNIYHHYLENHRQEDLDLAFDIMYEFYPEYKEVAKEYLEGDLSNFCNMFIFRKEIFMDYCNWIFSILEEFEKQVDTTEKRFFISERLTGVYIAKLMKDKKLKYKVLPISFISENVSVPLVLPVCEESGFTQAVTLTSLLKNKDEKSIYHIYLLCDQKFPEKERRKYQYFEEHYENCQIEFIEVEGHEEFYPLMLSELLPNIGKCIYLTDNVIVLKDLTEFYRTCSTDDYYIVGSPLIKYDIQEKNKKISLSVLVMNLAKFRKHGIWAMASGEAEGKRDATIVLNKICNGQIGYIPWYFATVVSQSVEEDKLFQQIKTRGEIQAEAAWKPILLYDKEEPWINPQGVYSIFWWELAVLVPVSFKFVQFNLFPLEVYFSRQQQEMNLVGTKSAVNRKSPEISQSLEAESKQNKQELQVSEPLQEQKSHILQPTEGQEVWRNYSLFGKLKFYYIHNGLKKTIAYCFRKYIKREEIKI